MFVANYTLSFVNLIVTKKYSLFARKVFFLLTRNFVCSSISNSIEKLRKLSGNPLSITIEMLMCGLIGEIYLSVLEKPNGRNDAIKKQSIFIPILIYPIRKYQHGLCHGLLTIFR